MRRHRFLYTLLLLAGLGAVLYVGISLFVPSPRRMIVGVDRSSGAVRVAEQSIAFLPPHQYRRLIFDMRDGAAHHEGIAVVSSRDGVPVKMHYQLRFSLAEERMPDAHRLVRDGWAAWIRARVAEAVSALTTRIPIDELVSPSSEFTARRDLVRRTVANHLAQSGVRVTSFELERVEVDHEELLRHKRAELRRNARGAVGRVAVLGLDGADWELVREMMIDGHMPNLEAILDAGTSGVVQPVQPPIAPLAWTSLATGLTPDRHGVIDFVSAGTNVVSSGTRRAPALWEMADAFGRSSEVVSWWTAWPPTRPDLVVYDVPMTHLPDAVHPATAGEIVKPLTIPESTIDFRQMSRFLNVTEAEFRAAISSGNPNDPIVALRSVLAKTWSDHRAAIALFEARAPMLTMVLYGGTDTVHHLFGPYHPPKRSAVPMTEYRKYWPTVARFYGELDRLIGEWVKVLPTDTTLMIVSPYGMTWGDERAIERPSGGSELDGHRRNGIFIAFGNRIARSPQRRVLSVYDVAPTVLALLGLPISTDMSGSMLDWALDDVDPVESVRIISYSEMLDPRPLTVQASQEPQSYLAQLRLIGHVVDPERATTLALQLEEEVTEVPVGSESWGRYAYLNNLGVQLARQDKFAEAEQALENAIALNPGRSTPYLNLTMALLERQRYTDSQEIFFEGITRGVAEPVQRILDFAAWHRKEGNTERAIQILARGKELFPESPEIAANLGSAMAAGRRYTDAVPELERALALRPSSTLVLNNLGQIYVRRKEYARALDYWNRSLAIDPGQVQIRQGVESLRRRL